ncbi:MAG: discoidin domain-containing protein [Planctomycetota bacterium]
MSHGTARRRARAALLSCLILVAVSFPARADESKVEAYASSANQQSPANYAIDAAGAATSWRTDEAMPQWIALDLGQPVELNRIRWSKQPLPGGPRDYDIQLTNVDLKHDGKVMWQTVERVRGAVDRCRGEAAFRATRARFIRIYVQSQNPSLDKEHPQQFAIGNIEVGFAHPGMVPERLQAEPTKDGIRLSWRPPPFGPKEIAGYNVYRTGNPQDGFRLINMSGPIKEPSYLDEAVVPGMTLHYQVSAVASNGGWEGNLSPPVTATTTSVDYALGKERPGVSRYAVGRFGVSDYLGHFSATEGLMVCSVAMEWNRQFYLTCPTLQNSDRPMRGLEQAGFPYSPKPMVFGTVRPKGMKRGEIPDTRILSSTWTSLEVEIKYKGARMVLYESLLSPAVAVKVEAPGVDLFDEMTAFGIGGARYIAHPRGRQAESGILSKSRLIAPKMAVPWLMVWFAGGKGWETYDMPWMVTFQNRPDIIRWTGQYLDISFQDQCGFITLAPLYGPEKLIDTEEWKESLPPAAAHHANRLVPFFHAMPVGCEESFAVDYETNRVKIKQQYKFLNLEGQWEIAPVRYSPLPPIAALAMRSRYPIKTSYETQPMRYDTTFGPLYAAIDTDIIEWEVPGPLDILNAAQKPTGENTQDPEVAKTVQQMFSIAPAAAPQGLPAIPAPEEIRSKGQGRGMSALRLLEGGYRAWGSLDEAAKAKFASHVSTLFQEIKPFDIGSLRLIADPLTGKKGYVDSWSPDGFAAQPQHVRNAAEFLKGLWAYAFHFNKMDEIKSHWDAALPHFDLLCAASDWAMMSPLATIETGVPRKGTSVHLTIEETLAVYDGLLAAARMAKAVGDLRTYEEAVYMAAKVQVLLYAYPQYKQFASEYLPWLDSDGQALDPSAPGAPSLSGSTGADSWTPKTEPGCTPSPDTLNFYSLYLRNNLSQ